nr:MAG TPA: hypothetical protein [Caudoviricetes sp.]
MSSKQNTTNQYFFLFGSVYINLFPIDINFKAISLLNILNIFMHNTILLLFDYLYILTYNACLHFL